MRFRRAVSVTALLGSSLVVGMPQAQAADVDGAACNVTGTVSVVPPLTIVPGPHNFAATFTLGCTGAGDDAGTWTLTAVAHSPNASCTVTLPGNGAFTGGSTTADGTVTGGAFTFVSAGDEIVVDGKLSTSGDAAAHHVDAVLTALPDPTQDCVNTPVTSFAVTGGAVITDGTADADVEPCTGNGAMTYAPGITPVPTVQAIAGTLTLSCPLGGDDSGVWTVNFTATGTESCGAGTGATTGVAGGTPEGAVTGGSLTYVRSGVAITFSGTVSAAGDGAPHTVAATMTWTPPPNQNCVTTPITNAAMTGTATIADG